MRFNTPSLLLWSYVKSLIYVNKPATLYDFQTALPFPTFEQIRLNGFIIVSAAMEDTYLILCSVQNDINCTLTLNDLKFLTISKFYFSNNLKKWKTLKIIF